MKKIYSLFLLLIFIVFSCKGTPNKDQGSDDPGLSQIEKTVEKDQVETDKRFDGESWPDEDILAQDGIADGFEFVEDENTKMEEDDFQAGAEIEDKQLVEIVDVKETPDETPPSAPIMTTVQPPPPVPRITEVPPPFVAIEERSPVTEVPLVAEQSAQEDQDTAQDESAVERKPPPRIQTLLDPPPAVTAVKDGAPVPNQRLLVPPKEEIVFSRIVRVTAGQIVEIPFRGTGWVYLEELTSRRGITYDSRRNDPEGQTIIFRAEEAGTYALKFTKHDVIRDYILNDYVQVIVDEPAKNSGPGWFNPPSDRVRVTAEPRWPSALDESAMLRGARTQGTAPSSSANRDSSQAQGAGSGPSTAPVVVIIPPVQGTGTAPSIVEPVITPQSAAPAQPQVTTPQTPQIPQIVPETPAVEKQEKLTPEEMLKKAQDTFTGGNTASAIALLDQYLEYYPDGSDELYWMYGQFYEANTPGRNILLSLDYYRRLINEYPQSRRYNDARRRIAYLERFYINIQ
jgi:hypothetical protein